MEDLVQKLHSGEITLDDYLKIVKDRQARRLRLEASDEIAQWVKPSRKLTAEAMLDELPAKIAANL